MKPGDYAIPGDVSRTYARCAVLDNCGEIIKEESAKSAKSDETAKNKVPSRRGRPPGRRSAAQKSTAPENKAGLEEPYGGDSGDGTELDSGAGESMPMGSESDKAEPQDHSD